MAFLRNSNRSRGERCLLGKNLILQSPRMADFEQWRELRQQSEAFLRPFEPSWAADELTRKSFRKRVEYYQQRQKNGNSYAFFLKSRPAGQLLGGLTLSNVRYGVIGSGALGYWIGMPYARKGHMSEAIGILLPFAFKTLGLHRLEAACLTHNIASVALLQKTGFVREGLARKYLRIDGEWQDHLLFALLAEDYARSRNY